MAQGSETKSYPGHDKSFSGSLHLSQFNFGEAGDWTTVGFRAVGRVLTLCLFQAKMLYGTDTCRMRLNFYKYLLQGVHPAQPFTPQLYPLVWPEVIVPCPAGVGTAEDHHFPVEWYVSIFNINHCCFKISLSISKRSLSIQLDAENVFIVSKQKSKSDCISGYTAAKFIYTYHSSLD